MGEARMKRGVAVDELDNELKTIKHKYRGHTYVVHELPYLDYQKTVRAATTTDAETKEETFDADAHTAIILGKCVTVDGKKTTADALYERGTGLVRQLQRDASTLHFEDEKDEGFEDDDDDAGEAPASPSA